MRSIEFVTLCAAMAAAGVVMSGCKDKPGASTAPPPANVVEVQDMSVFSIDSKDAARFPVVAAEKMEAAEEWTATGTVAPDVSREVPVISLANGRVVDLRARLDDSVRKGQLLFRVQSPDVATAMDTYRKAVNDEHLTSVAYTRAQDLLKHGAVAQSVLEQAEDAEKDAKADLEASEAQLKILGVDKDHPSSVVPVFAPISGVIVAQNVTDAAAAGVALSGSATAFTIADLSRVWIVCDVHEDDLAKLHLGDRARIRLDAYPDKVLTGTVSDIGPILDPSIRTAKVRVEVANPGTLRLGMFATATFESLKKEVYAVVPADAVLHLHDRDWVYVPAGGNQFKRVEVKAGPMVEGDRQQILSGIAPGQQVMQHALLLNAVGSE